MSKPNRKVTDSENYWKLIGETGVIEKSPKENTIFASFAKKPMVLVKFDINVIGCGLIAHNEIENSLWILASDIEVLKQP